MSCPHWHPLHAYTLCGTCAGGNAQLMSHACMHAGQPPIRHTRRTRERGGCHVAASCESGLKQPVLRQQRHVPQQRPIHLHHAHQRLQHQRQARQRCTSAHARPVTLQHSTVLLLTSQCMPSALKPLIHPFDVLACEIVVVTSDAMHLRRSRSVGRHALGAWPP